MKIGGNFAPHRVLEVAHDSGSLTAYVGEKAELRLAVAEESREELRLARYARGVAGMAAVLNGAVAVTATWEGLHMIRSRDTRLEGANCLMMGAGCGLLATQIALGHPLLGKLGAGLLVAHGVTEVGLGLAQLSHERSWEAVTKVVHGGCLAAAELCPAVALPLYAGMAGATLAGLYLARSNKTDKPSCQGTALTCSMN